MQTLRMERARQQVAGSLSTVLAANTNNAWGVSFFRGDIVNFGQSTFYSVWPVRGGP